MSNFEDMKAKLMTVKEAFGVDAARAIIVNHGKAEKMADIPEANIDAVLAEADRVLAINPLDGDEPLSLLAEDVAIERLNALPEGASVRDALNAIYAAWLDGKFINPMTK